MARIGYLAMLVLLGLLGACSGPPRVELEPAPRGTPTGDPVTATIGPEGGSLTSADGVLTLEVPPGAVEAPTQFGVQPITNTAGGLGSGYRLSPEGRTFPKPMKLTLDVARKPPPSGAGLLCPAGKHVLRKGGSLPSLIAFGLNCPYGC